MKIILNIIHFRFARNRIDRARRTPSRAVGPRAFAPTPTMTSITPILAATQSPDVAARVAAEDALKHAEASDAGAYAKALVDELACASAPLATRQLAGVILKNTLDAKDEAKRRELRERWMTRDAIIRARFSYSSPAFCVEQHRNDFESSARVLRLS